MSSRPGFSPHRNFADNLRALCAEHGSIAGVCSAIGMNRQQFNKYLAGSTLPNAPSLERICGFFKVEPESLFRDPSGIQKQLSAGLLQTVSKSFHRMRRSTLRPGCYYIYTPWARDPSKCVRAALFVYEKDGMTLFSRFTKFRSPAVRQRFFLSGRHDGVVLESSGAKYLLATHSKGLGEMSLVSIGGENAQSHDFMNGLALVMDPSGSPVAMRAALEYRGASSMLRRIISEACILPLADPSIPEEVRQSVAAPPLEPFSLLDSLPQQARRRGGS